MTIEQFEQFTDYYNWVRRADEKSTDIMANMSKYEHMRIAVELMHLHERASGQGAIVKLAKASQDMIQAAVADMQPGSLYPIQGDPGKVVGKFDEDFLIDVGRVCNYFLQSITSIAPLDHDMVLLARKILSQIGKNL